MGATKALARLHICKNSPEPLVFNNVKTPKYFHGHDGEIKKTTFVNCLLQTTYMKYQNFYELKERTYRMAYAANYKWQLNLPSQLVTFVAC